MEVLGNLRGTVGRLWGVLGKIGEDLGGFPARFVLPHLTAFLSDVVQAAD